MNRPPQGIQSEPGQRHRAITYIAMRPVLIATEPATSVPRTIRSSRRRNSCQKNSSGTSWPT